MVFTDSFFQKYQYIYINDSLLPKFPAFGPLRSAPAATVVLPGSGIARGRCDRDRRRWSGPRVLSLLGDLEMWEDLGIGG